MLTMDSVFSMRIHSKLIVDVWATGEIKPTGIAEVSMKTA